MLSHQMIGRLWTYLYVVGPERHIQINVTGAASSVSPRCFRTDGTKEALLQSGNSVCFPLKDNGVRTSHDHWIFGAEKFCGNDRRSVGLRNLLCGLAIGWEFVRRPGVRQIQLSFSLEIHDT